MKYTLRITATYYDKNGNWRCRKNELPISKATAISLKEDYSGCPCPVIGEGARECNINVEILCDGKLFGGWTNI